MSTRKLALICFPGAPNLPLFAAEARGFFETFGLEVCLSTTPSSSWQARELMNGSFHIAGTAFDNVVAYCRGDGAADLGGEADFFAFMGATRIELALTAAPGIERIDQLRGQTLGMDALNTGFAFVLYDLLERAGLAREDYQMTAVGATPQRLQALLEGQCVATLTIEPFTAQARAHGCSVLATSSETYAHYQGGVFAARRSWATANADTLVAFIRAYLMGLRWCLDERNRDAAGAILGSRMPQIRTELIPRVLDKLLDARTGLTPEAMLDSAGVAQVLALRNRFAPASGTAALPDELARYVDLDYYHRALNLTPP